MTQKLQTIQDQVVSEEIINDYLFWSETKLTEQQKTLFKQMAISSNLNPFKREIYPVSFNGRMSVVTWYQVYIDRANMSWHLDWWNVEVIWEWKTATAKITIYRKDWSHPFIHEVYASEVAKDFGIWKTSPKFMLKKVAIGQWFRLAFPSELWWLPYTEDELNDGKNEQLPAKQDTAKIETVAPQKQKAKEKVNGDKFDEIIEEIGWDSVVEWSIVNEIFPDKKDEKVVDEKEIVLGAYTLHILNVKTWTELKEETKKFLQEHKMVKDHPMRDVIIKQYEELKTAFVE